LTSHGETRFDLSELIYKGAEADVYLGDWCGRTAVFKLRKRLSYRQDSLDRTIRTQRTIREAEMIHRAKEAGVRSPFLYFVDVPDTILVMEFVSGNRMKELVLSTSAEESMRLFRELGRQVAMLHSAGIMHGDLTTSNVIVGSGGLVLIDFGLSVPTVRLEDQAVDLRLIKETITGAHAALAKGALDALFGGYGEVLGEERLKAAATQLKQIERRGRYAKVD
jgi:TP53 regulating kinase-like protein